MRQYEASARMKSNHFAQVHSLAHIWLMELGDEELFLLLRYSFVLVLLFSVEARAMPS